MCLEVIRADFSPCEKSNIPKGQKKQQTPTVSDSALIQTVLDKPSARK